ncbi:saccharopine dehydrogenase C-terminal domain-containing protein [Chitinophaga nivalis]|uniref:Saccharopine dehydrogenase NADP-binding domain-containing protein n=1 Tax=Chitinophaga nivalis TaxID=2991709 RepID=A0ABT3IL41_9BACT|nr:saccharopine dehydrogenase C-terminal domain-containing protein [Chitinophaga nivalis]MCW3465624.1 saccharopine dehydrogenase NADP-binding domain-containing protein [Chitinophaga nivalis]MCW3484685.1 saccharopine dehydrogenase NADP-binding domain-containing protein [Chitinophaga nivalis]
MKNILLFGAGKSATSLIDYLLANAPRQKWHITVADHDLILIKSKIGKSYYATPVALDIKDQAARQQLFTETDLVISLLPPHLHIIVAKDCLQFNKNLLTASYIDPEVRKLQADIEKAGLLFMYEMGLDPGIDHMSAMKLIHSIEKKGGQIFSFKSYCGGLIAPDSIDNPWQYKVSWNARNIVLAGSSGATYREKGKVKELQYEQLFDHSKTIQVPGLGKLAYYPNRDSLGYMAAYKLEDIATFMRATLRFPDFCEGWNALIKLGLTNDTHKIQTEQLTFHQWATQQLEAGTENTTEEQLALALGVSVKSKVIRQLKFLGLLSTDVINLGEQTNATILQFLVENKLKMEPADKDMIVMMHEIEFERRNMATRMHSYMITLGEDNIRTAMAKTVGLPLGIMAKLILQDKVTLTGLQIPVMPEIYNPVLKELEEYDIRFEESFE